MTRNSYFYAVCTAQQGPAARVAIATVFDVRPPQQSARRENASTLGSSQFRQSGVVSSLPKRVPRRKHAGQAAHVSAPTRADVGRDQEG